MFVDCNYIVTPVKTYCTQIIFWPDSYGGSHFECLLSHSALAQNVVSSLLSSVEGKTETWENGCPFADIYHGKSYFVDLGIIYIIYEIATPTRRAWICLEIFIDMLLIICLEMFISISVIKDTTTHNPNPYFYTWVKYQSDVTRCNQMYPDVSFWLTG